MSDAICPSCLETVKAAAIACPHCTRLLPAGKAARRRRLMLSIGGAIAGLVILFVGSAAVAGYLDVRDTRIRCERDARIFPHFSAEECRELVKMQGKSAAFALVEAN